jgi:hypothetical protein
VSLQLQPPNPNRPETLMPTFSKASIAAIAENSAAVAAALGLDAEHTKVLAKVYALAKKN